MYTYDLPFTKDKSECRFDDINVLVYFYIRNQTLTGYLMLKDIEHL